jgi:hypothetical protein
MIDDALADASSISARKDAGNAPFKPPPSILSMRFNLFKTPMFDTVRHGSGRAVFVLRCWKPKPPRD